MTERGEVCFTFEAAIEMAVQMEQEGFRHYLQALRTVKNPAAKLILKDAALDELEHKFQLEKALVEGRVGGHMLDQQVPIMNLGYVLEKKELGSGADARQALAYAIHLEKGSFDFYRRMAEGCSGAPMGSLFSQIANDESRHLRQLEDLYEEHFLTEN